MRSRVSARLEEPAAGSCPHRIAGAVALLTLLFVALWPRPSQAAPVIPGGQEARIQSLFVPIELGKTVTSGCTLQSIAIEPSQIVVGVELADERTGRMELGPPGLAATDGDLPSFAVTLTHDDDEALRHCLGKVRDAVANNDDGQFWQSIAVAPASRSPRNEGGAGSNEGHDPEGAKRLREIADATSVLTGPWSGDGITRFAQLILVLLVVLAFSIRRDGLRWLGGLAVISLGAWLVRAWLSPEVAMAPWPYSRIIAPARALMESTELSSFFPDGIGLSELVFGSVWAFALLAPAAVYLHGRYLLGDPKRALAAALLLATLPLHIRFSRTDTAFIPSITTTALVFVLIHIATREKRALARVLALVLLPGAMAMMFEIRPLNIMYMPLMLGTCVIRGWAELDKHWVAAAAVLVSVVTFGIGVPNLLDGFSNEVREGLSFAVILRSLGVLFDWEYNILLNPVFTPTGVLVLAIYGGRVLYRAGERRVLAFLVVWLLMFLVAHAYIVPATAAMQARYHLHLVTPFIMLAGCGLAALEPGRWRTAIFAYVVATPLVHMSFITDTDYNDMREFQFVRRTAALIEDGCTVLEYTGQFPNEARYQRMATWVRDGKRSPRLRSVPTYDTGIAEGSDDPLVPEVRALVEQPPQCTYVYVGLACEGLKAPEAELHPACEAMTQALSLELVADQRNPSRLYDGNYRPGYAGGHPDHAHFRLFRVTGARRP